MDLKIVLILMYLATMGQPQRFVGHSHDITGEGYARGGNWANYKEVEPTFSSPSGPVEFQYTPATEPAEPTTPRTVNIHKKTWIGLLGGDIPFLASAQNERPDVPEDFKTRTQEVIMDPSVDLNQEVFGSTMETTPHHQESRKDNSPPREKRDPINPMEQEPDQGEDLINGLTFYSDSEVKFSTSRQFV